MTADFAAARLNMVESQVRTNDVTDLYIQDAMRVAPREELCGDKVHLAYADLDVEYAPGKFLLKPRDIAKLLQALKPRPGERALAIAAPYAAMVMRQIGLEVDEIDSVDAPKSSWYQVVVCEGAVAETPQSWIDSLALGGRLAVIERRGPVGKARIYLRSEDDVGGRYLFDATTAYLSGQEPRTTFAF